MRSVRLALAFAATVFVVAAAHAQPLNTPPKVPLAVLVLNDIDDPVVSAELKLEAEQLKALVARRKELWDEVYTTPPKKLAETTDARNEATVALLKKTLKDEQYKRATQLGAQSVLRARGGGGGGGGGGPDAPPSLNVTRVTATILTRYPELADAFKLTDDQKKQLTAPRPTGPGMGPGGNPPITMNKEQSDAAKEFLGPVAKRWESKLDPRIANRPVEPAGFSLLDAKDVRTELKLTEADAKTFAALAEKWQKLASDRRLELSPKEADEQGAGLKAESEKALATLKPEQVTRLKQIVFQTERFGGFGAVRDVHIENLHTDPLVTKELSVTDAQTREFQSVREAFEKDAATVLAAADSFDPAEKKLNELAAARRTKAEGVLTPDQTTKLKALVGEPFTGSTLTGQGFGPNPEFLQAQRTAAFGKYSNELLLLSVNKSIQEELKLDEKQIKQATEAQADLTSKFRLPFPGGGDAEGYAKVYAERSQAIEVALGKLLNEDQAKRFRQLMLQSREQRPDLPPGAISTVIRSAAAYPGMAETIRLSDEQKKMLLAGTAPDEVLTAEQKSAIKKGLGDPFKGDFVTRRAGGPTRSPQPSAFVRLFGGANTGATDALKLTDDQAKALTAAREAYRKAIQDAQPVPPFGLNPAQAAVAQQAALDAFEKAVTELLTADQKPRLAQLVLQSEAALDLVAALTAPETAKALELTKEQTEKLTALGAEATKLQRLRTTHIRSAPDQKLGLQMRDAADQRVLAVLTDGQKKKWNELIGEPLSGLQKTVPGGFGGFGGGGFGGGGFGGGFGGGGFGP